MTNYNAPIMISYVLYIFTFFFNKEPQRAFLFQGTGKKIPGLTDYISLKNHESKIAGIKLS